MNAVKLLDVIEKMVILARWSLGDLSSDWTRGLKILPPCPPTALPLSTLYTQKG